MFQIPKIIQHCYSTDRCCKKFYCFIFSFLSPLSSFFLFSSLSLTGSLSFLPVPVPSLFDQFGMFTDSSDNDSVLCHARSHPCSAMLDLADLTLRLPSNSPSSLSSLSTFHSTSLWLWVFFFFFCYNLGCGLWWQVVV